MNQSNFSLADVLTVLTALTFGFISFLGINFLNIGNNEVWGMPHTIGCILKAVLISIILFGTAFGAKRLKRINHSFKTGFILEVILLMLFIMFAVYFAMRTSPFPHFFTVFAQKSEIKSKLLTDIIQAENMFEAYEDYADKRKLLYEKKLIAVADAKRINPKEYKEYGFDDRSSVSDASQIDTKMFTVHADLFPTNYSDTIANNGLKEVATKWLQDSKSITTTWYFPLGSEKVVNDIDNKSNEWLNTLISLSRVREQGEQATDFDYALTFDDLKTHFTKFEKPKLLPIGLAVLAYLLMLLSWLVTKRDYRRPGLKLLFGLGHSSENEL